MSGIGPGFRPPERHTSPFPADRARRPDNAAPQLSGQALPPGGSHYPLPGMAGEPLPARLLSSITPLSPEQLALLLKNLLQMPKELVRLLAMFTTTEAKTEQALLLSLLTENPEIPVEALQHFLREHLSQAGQLLLALLQSVPQGSNPGHSPFSDLMNTLSELSGKAGKSPEEALHTAISLYLPYYPLHPPQAFSLRFEPFRPDEDPEAAGSEGDPLQLIIAIRTVAMGDFRISVLAEGPTRWNALVAHQTEATPFIPEIQSCLNDGLAECSLPSSESDGPLTVKFLEQRGADGAPAVRNEAFRVSDDSAGKAPAVEIHPAVSGRISAGLIQLAYLLIRAVLETDQRNILRLNRAKTVQ